MCLGLHGVMCVVFLFCPIALCGLECLFERIALDVLRARVCASLCCARRTACMQHSTCRDPQAARVVIADLLVMLLQGTGAS
jgi:hypothetical protein